MGKGKDWLITNMDEQTKQAIKAQAKDYGCTIPELLAMTFSPDSLQVPAKGLQSWTIHNMDYGLIRDIKRAAADMGKPVSQYIQAMIKQARQNKQAKVKALDMAKALIDDIYK